MILIDKQMPIKRFRRENSGDSPLENSGFTSTRGFRADAKWMSSDYTTEVGQEHFMVNRHEIGIIHSKRKPQIELPNFEFDLWRHFDKPKTSECTVQRGEHRSQ